MVSATTFQAIRLSFAILIVWILVSWAMTYIDNRDCDSLLKDSGEYPLNGFERTPEEILTGLEEDKRKQAILKTELDPKELLEKRDNMSAIFTAKYTYENAFMDNFNEVSRKKIWNDIRIGTDYICCYRDPTDPDNNVGRPFPMDHFIKDIWYRYMRSAIVNPMKLDPVPVTALSDNRFEEFEESIKSFQFTHPGKKILVYDLGLSEDRVETIKKAKDQFIYRKFHFEFYPEHVRDLANFSWKILLWAEVLEQFGGLMWFDTSIEWIKNSDDLIHKMRMDDRSFTSAIEERHHTIAYGVHPMMYTFFPSNITAHMYPYNMMKTMGSVIVFNTNDCKDSLMRWAMLCALNKDCIAPMGSRKECPSGTNKYQPHICHRYDQALLSILLANRYGITEDGQSKYFSGKKHYLVVLGESDFLCSFCIIVF